MQIYKKKSTYTSVESFFLLLIHLSIEPIPNEPKTTHKKELKINSFIIKGRLIYPEIISATANDTIMMKAKNPTTLFSLIVLLSLNNLLKKFFIVFGNLLNYKYQKNYYLFENINNMAKANTNSSVKVTTSKVSRPGVHSKTKTSKLKQSKNYSKKYKGQGR